jgi:transposase
MASPLVPDELWEVVEPLIPTVERRYRYPGRKRVPDRRTLTGILFVLKTGISWEDLPQEMGCGSGVTCWRRLRDWQEQGVWQQLHEALLARLHAASEIDWQRAAVDSSHVRAFGGGERTDPSPVDRRKPGSKHHLITCGHGNPLAAETTAANVNDITRFVSLVDAVPAIRGRRGRPRRRPKSVYGDRAYHSRRSRLELRRRAIKVRSPSQAIRTAPASAASVGWSSARSPGFTSTAVYGCATSGAQTSTRRS